MRIIWKVQNTLNRAYDQSTTTNEPRNQKKLKKKSMLIKSINFFKNNRTKALISEGYIAYYCSGIIKFLQYEL